MQTRLAQPGAEAFLNAPLPPPRSRPFENWQPTVKAAPSKGGVKAVHVELVGLHAHGRYMTLDADDWADIRARYGTRYYIKLAQDGAYSYVFVASKEAKAASGQPKANGGGGLSRLIAGAEHGLVVRHRDGDILNLRRTNLVVLSWVDAIAFKREQASKGP